MASRFLQEMAAEERKRRQTGGQKTMASQREEKPRQAEEAGSDFRRELEDARRKYGVSAKAQAGLTLPAMPAASAGVQAGEAAAYRGPEWAQRIVDRYKQANNQNIRENPVVAAEEKKRRAAEKGVDWRGIPMSQSPDGVRSIESVQPTGVQQAGAALSGAAKSYGASLANTEANLYDLTQSGRDVMNREYLEAAQLKYDQALRDYQETEALAKQHPEEKRYQKDLEASRNMLEAAERELTAYGAVPEIQQGATQQSYAVADQLAASGQADVERAKEGLGGLGKFAVDVGVGGAQLAADIGLGAATGGGTMLPLLLRSYGGGAQEARQEGATAGQAAVFGVASALTEVMTEKISSLGNFNTKAFGAGALDDILEGVVGAVERIGKTEAGRKALNRAASAGVGFLSEGAEEFVSGIVSPLLKWAAYSKEPIDWKETIEEAAYEFLVGGGIGMISGGAGGTDTSQVQQAYLSGVTEQANSDAYKAMAESGMFSPEARQAAQSVLGKMDTAWERSGLSLPGVNSARQEKGQKNTAPAEAGAAPPALEAGKQTGKAALSRGFGDEIMGQMIANRGGFSAEGREITRADSRLLENLGKITSSDIRVVSQAELDAASGQSGAEGVQLGNRLLISEDAERPLPEVAKHELTHRLQDVAPTEYQAFRDYVAEVYRADGTLEQYIDGMIRNRENAGITLTEEQALDEIAADYAGQLLVDEKAVRRLAGENRGLLEKLLDGLREFIKKIRSAFGGQDAQTAELEKAAKLWERALEAASQTAGDNVDAEAEPRFSIGYDQDNRPFVTVEEDILEGVPREDWVRTVKDNLRKKFPNGVTEGNSEIKINRQSRQEMTYSQYMKRLFNTEPETYADKLRATNNADEILQSARGWINEAPLHQRADDIADFARGEVQLRIGKSDYTAEVIVGNRGKNGLLLYDIINLAPTSIQERAKKSGAEYTANTQNEPRSRGPAPDSETIPQSVPDVKPLRGLQLMDDRDYSQVGTGRAENTEQPTTRSFSEEIMRQLTGEADDTHTAQHDEPEGLRLRAVDDSSTSETKTGKIPGDSDTDRFSMKGDIDLKKEVDRLRRQNQRLKEQMRRTDRAEMNREAVQQQARELLREYGSKYDKQTLYDRLEKLYSGIANQTLSESDMRTEARSIAEDILSENREQTNGLYEEYQELRKELRTRGLSIAPEYRADLESAGGYEGLRKQYFGKLRLGNNGAAVDRVYDDLAGRHPELFPDDILHPADQLVRITEVLDSLQPVMGNAYEGGMDQAAEYLAGELLERYFDTPEKAPTFADKQARKMAEQRARDRQQMLEAVAKERRTREKKLSELQKKNKEYYQRQRENREMRQLQQKTLKQLQWLNKNRNKAPSELRAEFDKVLGDIDIYAVNAANEMNWSKKHRATWRDLKDMYEDAQVNDPNFMPSAELKKIVDRLSADKIGDMDVGALQDLYKAAVGLRTEFYNRKNVINDERGRLFAEVYEGAKKEIEGASGGAKPGGESYDMGKADRFLNMEQLTPMNYLERMGGWNTEGQFYSMARQLEQGERDMRRYRVQAESMLEDFLTKNADWVKRSDGQGKNAVWYEIEVPELLELKMGDKPIFGDTVKVYMTPAQKVHMYLESKNYDNLRHMAGGRTFADKALYSKGKRQEAFAQGKTVRLAPETVKKIVSDLTVEEMAMAEALEKYYNQFASGEINKKSNILYGYDKAMSSSYAPIYSNQNYVQKEVGVYDTTAEGVGRLKARQHSQNPSYQISAMDAFERHVDQTSRFVGMAIPARNWNTLLKWQETNNSMRDVISHKWGDASVKYIEDLLNTLQGGGTKGKKTLEGMADKALSNYVTGVFGANPGIVLKQAASFPQFAAALGWKNLPGALGKANEQIINAYTSELAYRTLGYSTPETAQLKNNPNWLDTNKVTQFALRGGAITAMDAATVKRAWPWAESKVRKEHPELEVGTRKQIEAGESPFYKKVAEEFENAVSLTQPMYDEMHRPGIMKGSSGIQRAFTMFKTVPLQQYNTLRRAFGEAAAANQRAKNAKGTEAQKQAKDKAKQAAQTAGAAVTATLSSVLMLEGIEFLNQWFKNAAKGYRDDDDDLTAESALLSAARKAAGDLTGMVIGGGELTDIIANIFTGEQWWGIEIPGGEQINDVIDSIRSAAGTIEQIVGDGVNIVENGGDLNAYFRRYAGDYAGAAKEIAEKVSMYLGGLPVENIEKYIMGGLRIAAPELYEAAQSTFNTPEKNDMTGLKGKALEARVGSVMRTRGVDISDKTAAELAALYQAGYKEAIPSNTPSSLTVNEESRKLDAYQKQTYDLVWNETLADCMDELIASKEYQEESEEARARILDRLYGYAREKAKEALFDDYEVKESTRKADAVIQAGALPGEWAAWATAPDEDMKAGENKLREIRELRYSIWGDEVKDAALKGVLGDKDYERLQEARKAGISIEKWCDLYEAIANQKIKRTGKSGSPNQTDVAAALEESGLTEKQKNAVWNGYGWSGDVRVLKYDSTANLAEILEGLEPEPGEKKVSNMQKYRAVLSAGLSKSEQLAALERLMSASEFKRLDVGNDFGVTPDLYIAAKEAIAAGDTDGNGTINQDEAKKVLKNMNGLTKEQKAVLWQIQNKSWNADSNPFSMSTGRKVKKALTDEVEGLSLPKP